MSAFDYSGPSCIVKDAQFRASRTEPQRRASMHRDNSRGTRAAFSPPVVGATQSQIDRDATQRIEGKRNDRRSQ
jgi:hypothetical protein